MKCGICGEKEAKYSGLCEECAEERWGDMVKLAEEVTARIEMPDPYDD